jgi:hypothetical protein
MPKTRDARLDSLVGALVEGWGAENVRHALERASPLAPEVKSPREGRGGGTVRQPKKKPTAREQVAKLPPSYPRKDLLTQLADLFDSRDLMPSVADARSFLELRGFASGAIKDRSDAFRAILRAVTIMSDERWSKFAHESLRAAPSKLGPLSEAIASTAAQNRDKLLAGAKDAPDKES